MPDDSFGISHLGIQVEDEIELAKVYGRLARAERPTAKEKAATCCYARSPWLYGELFVGARSSRRMIFPVAVSGSDDTKTTSRGAW